MALGLRVKSGLLNAYNGKKATKRQRGSEEEREESFKTEVELMLLSQLNHSQYKAELWALPDLFDVILGEDHPWSKVLPYYDEENPLKDVNHRAGFIRRFACVMHERLYNQEDSIACINDYVLEDDEQD